MNALLALPQVILIDLVLAGDNALVIGALVSRLEGASRQTALVFGIAAAIIARLIFTLSAAWLLGIPAIGVIGGLLLFWIAWKLYREAQAPAADVNNPSAPAGFWRTISAIAVADLSMSIDNILGVAAAAQGHMLALVIGLVASMALMGTAANWIAWQMQQRPWLIYIGIAAIVAAGARMICLGVS